MKNTKIMAVLVVLLAAMLFVGSAAALTETDMKKNLTATDVSGSTLALGIESSTLSFNVTNGTNAGPALTDVWYGWTTPESGFARIQAANVNGNNATIELTGKMFNTVGTYKLILSDNEGISSGNWTTTDVTFNVVNATEVTPTDSPNTAPNVFVNQVIFIEDGPDTLVLYDGKADESSALHTISGKDGIYYLLESAVKGYYGSYYTGSEYVNIWDPSLTLKVELAGSPGSSVNGNMVTRETELAFYVEAPVVANANVGAQVQLVFKTPSGGSVTMFGGENFERISLTEASQLVGTITPGDDAQAGTWTVQAKYISPDGFKNYAAKSNTITFTVQSSTLTLTAAEPSVIRSNPFLVTISGEAEKTYALVVEDGYSRTSGIYLLDGQKDVTLTGDTSDRIADVKTDSSGKINVQFETSAGTEDKSYTIKVYGILSNGQKDTSNYESVSINVEKGSVTASAPGNLIYYLGEEVDITGTNSDSRYVQIYYEGPNTGFTHLDDVSVKEDKSWEFKFDTSDKFNSKDGASYTFYFVGTSSKYSEATKITGSDALTDYEYATLSMTFKKPFISATTSASVVASGDDITISGTAEGNPSTVKYYIFGTNYYKSGKISVKDDSTFEEKIRITNTQDAGQYYVVVEHPMENGVFDVHQAYLSGNGHYYNSEMSAKGDGGYVSTYLFIPQAAYFDQSTFDDDPEKGEFPTVSDLDLAVRTSQSSFVVDGSGKLQSSQAADTLGKNINDANIDDTYVKLTFNVVAPKITIDAIADQAAGSTFTISGTTNLAVDGEVLVNIQSSAFEALDKSQQAGNSGYTQTAKIVAGDGVDNEWEITVDSTNWELDEYNVKAEVIGKSVSDTAKFNLVEKTVTPTATATATATTTATATATTAPTQTPGFGAFVALAGLGAVALLVLRRN